MMNITLRKQSAAGDSHVAPTPSYGGTGRFDEGNVALAKPWRGSLLYKNNMREIPRAMTMVALALLTHVTVAESLTVPSGTSTELAESKTYDELIVNGTLVIRGSGTAVTANMIHVAESGCEGVLEVKDGAELTCPSGRGWDGDNSHYPFSVGYYGGKGVLKISGEAKLIAKDIIIGDQNHSGAGTNPSYGILDVADATATVSGNLWQARGNTITAAAVWNSYYSDIHIHTGGVVNVTGIWTHNATSEARVLFDGGRMKYAKMRCQGGSALCLEGVNGNAIDVETTSTDPLFYFNAETAAFRFSADGGGLFVRGGNSSGNALFGGASSSDFKNVTSTMTGPIVLNDNVTLALNADMSAFYGSSLILKGTGSVFDLRGKNAAFAAIDEQSGRIANSTSASSTLTLGEGTTTDQTLVGLWPNVGIVWKGTGKLMLGADRLPGLVVESGSVELQGLTRTGYRMYGFKVDSCYGASASCMQFSELVLKDAVGQDLRLQIAETSSAALFDGDYTTKCWYDAAKGFDNMLVTATFAEARPVATYTWVTANDYGPKSHDRNGVYGAQWPSQCRDPAVWKLLGSNDGGQTWTEISRIEGFEAPDAPNVLVGQDFGCTYSSRFVEGGSFVVAEGASLAFADAGDIVCDAMEVSGTVTAAGTVTVRQNVGSDEDEVIFFKPGSLGSSITKNGSGTTLAYVGNTPVSEAVTVESGTLHLAQSAIVTEKYWRIRIKQLQGTNASPTKTAAKAMQFAELGLYDANGVRVAYGETAPTALAGCVLKVANAFDNVMTSVVYKDITGSVPQPDPTDEATWMIFSFKIPDGVAPIAAYLFSSGHDTHNERHPYTWDVLVSSTGEDGSWRVLDEKVAQSSTDDKQSFNSFNGGTPWTFVGKSYGTDAAVYSADAVVKIGAGARLELPGTATVTGVLEIDATQAEVGTLSHFNAASTGVLNVIGLEMFSGASCELPIYFENAVNADAVGSWTLKLDGITSTRYKISVRNGRILLSKCGLIITFH